MGQGEDGGEIKDLPRKLITATLLKHKEKEVPEEKDAVPAYLLEREGMSHAKASRRH